MEIINRTVTGMNRRLTLNDDILDIKIESPAQMRNIIAICSAVGIHFDNCFQ